MNNQDKYDAVGVNNATTIMSKQYNNYDNNAYLIQNGEEIELQLTIKLNPEQLQKSLPLTHITPDKTHLSAYFSGGQDFVGALSLDEIMERMSQTEHIDLINNDYETIVQVLPNLTRERYDNLYQFTTRQLKPDTNSG